MKARTLLLAAWGAWEAGALLRLRETAALARSVTAPLDVWLAGLPIWGLALALLLLCTVFGVVALLLAREVYNVARFLARRLRAALRL